QPPRRRSHRPSILLASAPISLNVGAFSRFHARSARPRRSAPQPTRAGLGRAPPTRPHANPCELRSAFNLLGALEGPGSGPACDPKKTPRPKLPPCTVLRREYCRAPVDEKPVRARAHPTPRRRDASENDPRKTVDRPRFGD